MKSQPMRMEWLWISILAGSFALLTNALFAQSVEDATQEKEHFFERHIRPALHEFCLECHATNTESNGGLTLDAKLGWELGGDSGPAVVPGQPDKSRLLKAILYDDPKLKMPPERKLPADLVKRFEQWIQDGAVDPRVIEGGTTGPSKASVSNEARSYWSYQPIRQANLPDIATTGTDIDRFVESKLAEMKIRPESSASRREQIRRIHFDLTGLPPSMKVIEEFEQVEDFDAAYKDLVDQLLASPRYGEAFARRWMDVVRYAESVTLRGLVFKQAWRYRDYLVDAYSSDRPFDQMIREQIAGDLLASDDRQERWKQLVATSLLAMGDTNFEEQDKEQLDMDYIDEQLDVIGQAFLGQTIGCARCHDHKFDPIPTKDYYALAGIFRSAVSMRHSNVSNWIDQPLPLPEAEETHFARLESELEKLNKELAAKKKLVASIEKKVAKTKETATKSKETTTSSRPDPKQSDEPKKSESDEAPDAKATVAQLNVEIKELESQIKELKTGTDLRPRYLTVVEESPAKDLAIHVRGDVHNLGQVVPRGFLSAIKLSESIDIPSGASGRLEFAKWVASAENPLTARVYANRVWMWLMGRGLVDSPNNFGTTGEAPSNLELLDWLANELIQSGWSTKHLVRCIVMSDAYRRRYAEASSLATEKDPENRLYWRGNDRRLSVEELRDSMLIASGELDLSASDNRSMREMASDSKYLHDSKRRSLYEPVLRNSLPNLYQAFDFAQPSVSVGQRNRSTVATQALALMNDSWVKGRAKSLANRLRDELGSNAPEEWIRVGYQRCFQRLPSEEEFAICMEFFEKQDLEKYQEQLERMVQTLFASVDFRYLGDQP